MIEEGGTKAAKREATENNQRRRSLRARHIRIFKNVWTESWGSVPFNPVSCALCSSKTNSPPLSSSRPFQGKKWSPTTSVLRTIASAPSSSTPARPPSAVAARTTRRSRRRWMPCWTRAGA